MSPAAIAALLAILGPPVEATEPVSLAWLAPGDCPQREVIDARVRELLPGLGPLAPADALALLRVEGRIEPADGWTVSLAFEGERGRDERSFSGPDCAALADAAALVIAITIDPLGVSTALSSPEPPPPAEDPADEAVEPPPVEPVEQPEPEPTPESTHVVLPNIDEGDDSSPIQFAFSLLGGGGYGPLDLGQASVGAELGVVGLRWRAGVRGLWLPPRSSSYAGGDSASFDGFAIGARGCGVPSVGRVEFPICAGVEGGLMHGDGRGSTPDPRDARLPWAAALVGPSLRFVLGRFALGVDLELVAPLVRGGFTIADTVVQRFTPAGVRGLVAVELRLP